MDNSNVATLVGQPASLLSGVNVLLEGPTGTGKTHSLGTLVDTGAEVFFLGLESGMESLIGYWTDRGLPVPENLHWHNLRMTGSSFELLAEGAKRIGEMTQESLYKMVDHDRAANNQFERVLRVLCNFEDQRTGKSFGPVDKWGPNRALAMDGLTGLGNFALGMVTGKKPMISQPDWGLAQGQVERLLRMLTDGCRCHFVLIAHIEREPDLVMGGVKVTVQSLGKALPPKIPPMFSDVILTMRDGTKWSWSTANNLCDLKTRNLKVAEGLPPDFATIISKWKSRGGSFSETVKG